MPGMIVTPWTSTSPPARSMADFVKSRAPAEEPPITSTASKVAVASRMTRAISSTSSRIPVWRTALPPRASMSLASTVEFDSMMVPGSIPLSPTLSASTISPPVGTTRTLGRLRTPTEVTPPASSAPVQ